MRLFIIDDCNDSWDEKMDFFIYGGLVVPEAEAKSLAEQLILLKKSAEINRARPIKWTNNGWHGEPPLDTQVHADIKDEILKLVAASGCKIIVCASPQTFYHQASAKGGKTQMKIDMETLKRTQEYGLTDSMKRFNKFLREEDELGMVFADTFVTAIKPHMDLHCFNLFPGSFPMLDRIIHPVIQVDNEESHLHQINDVVLGAIYFSLREMEHNFLPTIRDNFWMTTSGDYSSIIHKGLTIFPLMAKQPYIALAKQKLQEKFLRLITAV